jgi:hypothetical protein
MIQNAYILVYTCTFMSERCTYMYIHVYRSECLCHVRTMYRYVYTFQKRINIYIYVYQFLEIYVHVCTMPVQHKYSSIVRTRYRHGRDMSVHVYAR